MPRIVPSASDLTPIGLIRCYTCHRVLPPYVLRFRYWCRQGIPIGRALDWCGLPDHGPFLTSKEETIGRTPPIKCCRAILMTMIDLGPEHMRYKQMIAAAEGSSAVSLVALETKESFVMTTPSWSDLDSAATSKNAASSVAAPTAAAAAASKSSSSSASAPASSNKQLIVSHNPFMGIVSTGAW